MNANEKLRFHPFKTLLSRQYEYSESGYNPFSRSMLSRAKQLYQKDLKGHYGCVNALEFSKNGGEFIVSGKHLFMCFFLGS